jgi:hypothetical protein
MNHEGTDEECGDIPKVSGGTFPPKPKIITQSNHHHPAGVFRLPTAKMLPEHLAARALCVVLDGPTCHKNTAGRQPPPFRDGIFLTCCHDRQAAAVGNGGLSVSITPMISVLSFCFAAQEKKRYRPVR